VSTVIAVDAGTTGVRALAFDETGSVQSVSYRELTQHFPRPGWVEHDPEEIIAAVRATLGQLTTRLDAAPDAIGITNQRETAVAWDRRTGRSRHRAIVWQDRRTADRCAALAQAGHLPLVRERTGLVLDPYFSATKFEWLLSHGSVEVDDDLALGTVDSWVLWHLTGGRTHATDPSNASRTMLYDIRDRTWSAELAELLGVPLRALPEVRPSSGRFGQTTGGMGVAAGIPISGIAGDQQAALFGQACLTPGMTKNTYGTGSFVLMNVGPTLPPPVDGLLTSVAWELADGAVAYALEGSIFVTGAAVQWLRDGLRLITEASETERLAGSVPDNGGVVMVPAFAGLGSPYWDPYARGTIAGITRGVTAAHITRAVVESMAFQTRDVVDAMTAAASHLLTELRVDGGASAMDLLLQLQADQLGVTVRRPRNQETTAAGAAFLAGLAEGVWATTDEVSRAWQVESTFEPASDRTAADGAYAQWRQAVDRSRRWAAP
jgi:glycerol kinase